jgi:hypothetical protein
VRIRADIEDVLTAPAGEIFGIVLDGLKNPVGFSGHGVDGDFTKKTHFALGGASGDAFDECVEVFGISQSERVVHDEIGLAILLVSIDGITNLAQITAQFCFTIADDHRAGEWNGHGGHGHEDAAGDNELDESEGGVAGSTVASNGGGDGRSPFRFALRRRENVKHGGVTGRLRRADERVKLLCVPVSFGQLDAVRACVSRFRNVANTLG